MKTVREPFTKEELQQLREDVRHMSSPALRAVMTRMLWEIFRLRNLARRTGQFAVWFPERVRGQPVAEQLLKELRREPVVMERYPEIAMDPPPPKSEWSREEKRQAREDRNG
jgi:hypothetical protein